MRIARNKPPLLSMRFHGDCLEAHCPVESFGLAFLNPPYDWTWRNSKRAHGAGVPGAHVPLAESRRLSFLSSRLCMSVNVPRSSPRSLRRRASFD